MLYSVLVHGVNSELYLPSAIGPPQIVIHPPPETEGVATRTVTFSCVAFGVPRPSFNWTRNGDSLTSVPGNILISEGLVVQNNTVFTRSVLEMCDVDELDAGEYSCIAGNGFGMDNATFQLLVFGKAI